MCVYVCVRARTVLRLIPFSCPRYLDVQAGHPKQNIPIFLPEVTSLPNFSIKRKQLFKTAIKYVAKTIQGIPFSTEPETLSKCPPF